MQFEERVPHQYAAPRMDKATLIAEIHATDRKLQDLVRQAHILRRERQARDEDCQRRAAALEARILQAHLMPVPDVPADEKENDEDGNQGASALWLEAGYAEALRNEQRLHAKEVAALQKRQKKVVEVDEDLEAMYGDGAKVIDVRRIVGPEAWHMIAKIKAEKEKHVRVKKMEAEKAERERQYRETQQQTGRGAIVDSNSIMTGSTCQPVGYFAWDGGLRNVYPLQRPNVSIDDLNPFEKPVRSQDRKEYYELPANYFQARCFPPGRCEVTLEEDSNGRYMDAKWHH